MPLKILFLTHKFFPDIGGIETNSEILAHTFTAAGHEVRVMTWSDDPSERHFPFLVVRNPTTHRIFEEHQWADVVFENNPSLRLSWPGLLFNKPSVVALNTTIVRNDGTRGLPDYLKLQWLKRAYKVVSVSHALGRLCWPTATVIPNPYRVEQFRVLPHIGRTFDFVFLGRLVSQKGVHFAIHAIERLNKVHLAQAPSAKPMTLTIIGDGPERAGLERLVRQLHLEDQVCFTGALRDQPLVECLNRHRYLLAPSLLDEAFGNVVLEGLACGCLPIVSDSGGLPEAAGQAGLLFRRGNLEALVTAIRRVLDSPALERQLRQAAPAHLAAHHPDIIAQKYLRVLLEAAV